MDAPRMAVWNLVLRFALELAALFAIGAAGWHLADTWPRYALVIVLPLTGVVAWGLFNVPGDPSRSGAAPVRVPGILRLLIELSVLGAGGAGFALVWGPTFGVCFGIAVLVHYACGWRRLAWLVRQ